MVWGFEVAKCSWKFSPLLFEDWITIFVAYSSFSLRWTNFVVRVIFHVNKYLYFSKHKVFGVCMFKNHSLVLFLLLHCSYYMIQQNLKKTKFWCIWPHLWVSHYKTLNLFERNENSLTYMGLAKKVVKFELQVAWGQL
jgi:hypothetical protein